MLERLQKDYSFWISWAVIGILGNVGYTLGTMFIYRHTGFIWIWIVYAIFIVVIWYFLYAYLMQEMYYLKIIILSEELEALYKENIESLKKYTNSAETMIEILDYYGEEKINENYD